MVLADDPQSFRLGGLALRAHGAKEPLPELVLVEGETDLGDAGRQRIGVDAPAIVEAGPTDGANRQAGKENGPCR